MERASQPSFESNQIARQVGIFLGELHRAINGIGVVICACKSERFHHLMASSRVLQVAWQMRRVCCPDARETLGYESDPAALEGTVKTSHRARRVGHVFQDLDADHNIEAC